MNMSLSRLNNLNYNTQIILLYVFLSIILDLVNLVLLLHERMGEGRGGHVIIIKLQYDVYLGGGGMTCIHGSFNVI